jgi:hypothetical protein
MSAQLDLLGDVSATQVERAETSKGDGVSNSPGATVCSAKARQSAANEGRLL